MLPLSCTGVVIPIRAFTMGKARLAATLDADERARLGRHCAERVVAAAGDLRTLVVSSDAGVRRWAHERSLTLVDDPGSLDGAASLGRAILGDGGCTRVVVAHADLPHARTFAGVIRDETRPVAVIVPCHRDDGTPVLSLPTAGAFEFSYGPGSYRRHAAEARRRGLAVRVVRDPDLAFDVDVPDDLVALAADVRSA
jgi:2-phospho-L-lactate guanylyltransferase